MCNRHAQNTQQITDTIANTIFAIFGILYLVSVLAWAIKAII